jgi:hypothetical protein
MLPLEIKTHRTGIGTIGIANDMEHTASIGGIDVTAKTIRTVRGDTASVEEKGSRDMLSMRRVGRNHTSPGPVRIARLESTESTLRNALITFAGRHSAR